MHSLSIESKFVTNEVLFELKKNGDFKLSKEIKEFLIESIFPWKSLGKPLTQFVTKRVQAASAAERIRGTVSNHAFLIDPELIVIEEGAVVEPGAFVAGPTYIESGAVIRHGAYVRGSAYICSGAVVGHTTEVKGAILLPEAKAAHFNYVGDSILGVECNLGAGTKLANLKISHGTVFLRLDSKRVDTGLKKFGAILGNRAQTGCNSVTNPGTIFLPEAVLLPNETAIGILRK